MNVLIHFSDILIPAIIFYIVGFGLIARQKVYEIFLKGAKSGLLVVVEIMPTLVGLMVAVNVLRGSGFLTFLGDLLAPLAQVVGLPEQILPLLAVKLFSSSAATGLLLDIFKTSGPDSYVGMIASVLLSCTETLFYTMSVYCLAAKVTKTRYIIAGALLSTVVGLIMSVILSGQMV